MSVKKVVIENGETRWEVYGLTSGRTSSRMRRRFATRKEAEDFLAEFRTQKSSVSSLSTVRSLEDVEFKSEADYWLSVRSSRFSPGHRRGMEIYLKKFNEEFGNWRLGRFSPVNLTQIQSRMLKDGITPATVNRRMSVILAILNLSARHRRIPFNPSLGFERLPEIREELKFWERDEAASFLEFTSKQFAPGSRRRWIYVVYLLALNTGLRAGEIWGLQPADLMEDGQVIFVRRQYDAVLKQYGPPKGKKTRRVPCNEALRRELLALIPPENLKSNLPIFVGRDGRPRDHKSFVNRWFKGDLRRWKGRNIRFHDLRHTAATLMVKDGIDLKTVQEICGHQDISTTMGYTHLVKDSIQNVAKTFQILGSATKLKVVSS